MNFLKKQIVVILFFLSNTLFSHNAVNFTGQIVDKLTNIPIIGVSIQLVGTSFGTYSDESGKFTFSRVPDGFYEIKIQMVGYLEKINSIQINSYEQKKIIIELIPVVYQLPVVVVEKEKDEISLDKSVLSFYYKIDSTKNISGSISNVLKSIPGITLQKTEDGNSKILMNGSEAKHVKILLDGIDLTNPQTGEANLDIVPIDRVEKIEVSSGGIGAKFGSGALGGIVNFITSSQKNNFFNISTSVNSYGWINKTSELNKNNKSNFINSRKIGISFGASFFKNFNLLTSFTIKKAENAFIYSYQNKDYLRKHNMLIQRKLLSRLSLKKAIKKVEKFSIQLSYNSDYNQLPSYYFNQFPYNKAYNKEKYLLLASELNIKIFDGMHFNSSNNWRAITNRFDASKEPDMINRFDAKSNNSVLKSSNFIIYNYFHNLMKSELGFEFQSEKLDMNEKIFPQRSMGKHVRNSKGLIFSNNLCLMKNKWQFNAAIVNRFDKYFKTKWNYVPSISSMLGLLENKYSFKLFAQAGKGFKYPSLNSLFWVPYAQASGNPQLKPELGKNIKWGLYSETLKPFQMNIKFSIYKNNINNYIVWVKSNSGWKPINLFKTEINGFQINSTINLNKYLTLFGDFYKQNPINKTKKDPNYFNKTIPNIFKNQIKVSLNYNYKNQFSGIYYQFNSYRESMPYNTPNTYIPGFELVDINYGMKIKIKKINFTCSLEVNNLFAENYQLIIGYPMPGRNYKLSLLISN